MNSDVRDLFTNLGGLNNTLGLAVRDLLHGMGADGRLPVDQLRHLRDMHADMVSLIDKYLNDNAEGPVVVTGTIAPDPSAGATKPPPVAPAGVPTEVHQRIAELRDSACRAYEQGLIDAGNNFAMAADQKVAECGCGNCEAPTGA